MRLKICELTIIKLAGQGVCQLFKLIYILATTIVSTPRTTFGILIG
jgi:hypothetical protein